MPPVRRYADDESLFFLANPDTLQTNIDGLRKHDFFVCIHLNIIKLRNLLYGRCPLFLTEMYVRPAAHFRAMA